MSTKDTFAKAVSVPEAEIDLARAALAAAGDVVPGLDPEPWIARLDALGRALADRLAGVAPGPAAVDVVCRFLFEEQRFLGNAEAYYDPRNSLLHEVLERRLGIPITLTMVMMEVAARAGIQVEGVGFPGHFLAAVRFGDERVLLDPFHSGARLDDDDLASLLSRAAGPSATLRPEHVAASGKRDILVRMLRNLKSIYAGAADFGHALAMTNRILLLTPDSLSDVRDRGLYFARLECWGAAATDLADYLERASGADDAQIVRERLDVVRSQARRVN